MFKKIKISLPFIVFIFLSLIVRLGNFPERFYFIWDQGRDAVAIKEIAQGDLKLIGHTSGIQGFFLGPLWFYSGVPGYFLGGGNPWVICLWYLLLTATALPIFWSLGFELFPKKTDKFWAMLTAYGLSFIPGSLYRSTFIWNPMLGIPLVSLALLGLLKSKKNILWLYLSFLCLGLTLQAEFAYAIFFIIPVFLAIPLITGRKKFQDFVFSFLAVFITGLPQILFELRHQFIMTNSLIKNILSGENNISFLKLWASRPQQLYLTTQELLFGKLVYISSLAMILTSFIIIYGIIKIFKDKNKKLFDLKLILFLSLIPYFFYLLWRGNNGSFFDYYLTPHFVLLVPLIILLLKKLSLPKVFIFSFLLLVGLTSLKQLYFDLYAVKNEAGLKVMSQAIEQIYTWAQEDGQAQPVVRIFTPNIQTEHYDYIFSFKAKQKKLPVPLTTKSMEDKFWYLLLEPDHQYPPEVRLNPWYKEATTGGKLIRTTQIGVLKLESWQATE